MVPIYYHFYGSDPYKNSFCLSRGAYYGVSGTPHNTIDGIHDWIGSASITQSHDDYKGSIDADLLIPSPVELSVKGILDSTEGFVIVEVKALDPLTKPDLSIQFAVVEDNITYTGSSPAQHLRYVQRTMPAQELIYISAAGDIARAARNFTFGGTWKPADMKVVAFVQSVSTKDVLQSILWEGSPTATVDPVPIKANWASGTAPTIDGTFSAGEWAAAKETFVDLSYYVNFPFYVYSMNDGNYLYLCVDAVGDDASAGSHYSGLYFDTKQDGTFTTGEEDSIEVMSGGGNVFYKNWNGSTWANVVTSTSGVAFPAGTHDEAGLIGASGFGPSTRSTASHQIYEYKIPLALGALNATPGLKLRPYIYMLGRAEESYWSTHTKYTDPTTYGELTLATGSASIPASSILGIAILLLGISIFIGYKFKIL